MNRNLFSILLLVFISLACSKGGNEPPVQDPGAGGLGGVLPTPPGTTPSSMVVTMGTKDQNTIPSNRPFGNGTLNLPGANNIYAIGVGLTTSTGSVERFEIIGRALYADGSMGAPVRFINGSNTSTSYTPSGGWDLWWYAGYTQSTSDPNYISQFRVLSGVSFMSNVTKATLVKRTIGPTPSVGDAQYLSLPSGNQWQNVSFMTIPDFSANQPGAARQFFAITGIYLKGQGLRIEQAEIMTHRLFANWGSGTGQLEFRLGDPKTETIRLGKLPTAPDLSQLPAIRVAQR